MTAAEPDTPEARHRACWYSRRTIDIPPDIGFHTIEDGQLLYCAHPMWFPVAHCDYFKPIRQAQPRS